jgi:hypothetical protein
MLVFVDSSAASAAFHGSLFGRTFVARLLTAAA